MTVLHAAWVSEAHGWTDQTQGEYERHHISEQRMLRIQRQMGAHAVGADQKCSACADHECSAFADHECSAFEPPVEPQSVVAMKVGARGPAEPVSHSEECQCPSGVVA